MSFHFQTGEDPIDQVIDCQIECLLAESGVRVTKVIDA